MPNNQTRANSVVSNGDNRARARVGVPANLGGAVYDKSASSWDEDVKYGTEISEAMRAGTADGTTAGTRAGITSRSAPTFVIVRPELPSLEQFMYADARRRYAVRYLSAWEDSYWGERTGTAAPKVKGRQSILAVGFEPSTGTLLSVGGVRVLGIRPPYRPFTER
jgi:hypothetical protein